MSGALFDPTGKTATLSDDGLYRYDLTRRWAPGDDWAVFIIQGRSYGFWIDNQTAGRSAAARARIVAAQRAGAHPKHSDGGNDVCSRTGLDLTGAVGNNIDSGPCRWCHRPSYLADGGGWVHPCCEDWQGPDCPACRTSTGHATARHDRGGRTKGRR